MHEFGGDWTSAKLSVIAEYLQSYSTALKNTSFKKAYVDAFAGSGYRTRRRCSEVDPNHPFLFPDLADDEPQKLLDGSARQALRTEPRFDKYIYVEQDPGRCRQLEALREEFPDLSASIDIRRGEANEAIRQLCGQNWSGRRAVVFLDPYGLQVEWSTVEAIAATRSIDLWLLFPLGMGVNRLLTRDGEIPEAWQTRLDVFLGTTKWRSAFYRAETSKDLFGEQEVLVKAKTDVIGRYFVDRLATVFPAVSLKPGVLRNSTNCPLYLLCFATASDSERGREIALRIANHLLKRIS